MSRPNANNDPSNQANGAINEEAGGHNKRINPVYAAPLTLGAAALSLVLNAGVGEAMGAEGFAAASLIDAAGLAAAAIGSAVIARRMGRRE